MKIFKFLIPVCCLLLMFSCSKEEVQLIEHDSQIELRNIEYICSNSGIGATLDGQDGNGRCSYSVRAD